MLEYRTQGFNGCAVKYSPFFDSRLAVAASANFGLVGNGKFYIFDLTPQGIVPLKWYTPTHPPTLNQNQKLFSSILKAIQQEIFLANRLIQIWFGLVLFTSFTTQDALYDLAWSEMNENQALVGSGDGSIKLFDIAVDEFPVQGWKEHSREVFAVHWNLVAKDRFCSSSWDGTVKIWTPSRQQSLLTLPTNSCTYSAAFSPHSPDLVSCVTSDSHLRVFDLRTPTSASNHLALQIPVHGPSMTPIAIKPGMPPVNASTPPSEVLTHDWNKYRPTVVATAGVDRIVRTFDIRSPQQGPMSAMVGHEYAIRKLSWSPHLSHVLLTASYDMTARVWTDGSEGGGMMVLGDEDGMRGGPGPGPSFGKELGRMGRHTEFVMGVDWCLFGSEGWAASCGWDERLCVWDARAFMA
ncbi:peroxisomal targeting signal 2 receptor [Myotisia sp. PD_48]|nr:peroxisomal targeting signal 2 receptor [Myotisia sp. PD_48]